MTHVCQSSITLPRLIVVLPRPVQRAQITAILRATILALVGAVYLVVASTFRLAAPYLFGDLTLVHNQAAFWGCTRCGSWVQP